MKSKNYRDYAVDLKINDLRRKFNQTGSVSQFISNNRLLNNLQLRKS